MTNVAFSYGFTPFNLNGGGTIQRPLLSVRLTRGTKTLDTKLLVDSGADYSMIPREFAEDVLGIDVDSLSKEELQSVGNSMVVGSVELDVTITYKGHSDTFTALFQIPLNSPGYPRLPLLGREPTFSLFDVSFRMGYTDQVGKFVLKRVKPRDAAKYKVGGEPLRGGGSGGRRRHRAR